MAQKPPFTPKVVRISIDHALNMLTNQLSQFHGQPDGSFVRQYGTFSAAPNQSLKLYLDAGMNLDEIAFEAEKDQTSSQVAGLDKARTLGSVTGLNVLGKAAKVTLTKEQFEKLDGFYRAIAYPQKTPATNTTNDIGR